MFKNFHYYYYYNVIQIKIIKFNFQMLIVLKALGNLGLTTHTLEEKLKNCINDNEMNMAVRIAAVQSHRRLSCTQSRDFYLDIYKNDSIDSELRIVSYLEVMKCPNYYVTTVIRKSLETEEVNQGNLNLNDFFIYLFINY